MNTKTLQTRNVRVKVLNKAEKQAVKDGLSSVQDAVRIFLTKYAHGEMQIGFKTSISSKKEEEYMKDAQKTAALFEAGKIKAYDNADDLIKSLHTNETDTIQ